MKYRNLLAGVLLLAAGGPSLAWGQIASEPATPDREMGLSKTSVFDVPSPPSVVEDDSAPGEHPPLKRVHPESPPLVPHGVLDFLPITWQENLCIECHRVEEKVEGEPTPIPISHYTDLRSAPQEVRAEPVGARYYCVTCHLAATHSRPLVENRFAVPPGD